MIGDDAVMVIDTQATPVMAQDVIRRIRGVTDKPIRYVVLSHYHAVRVLGASGYAPEHIIASRDTYDLIVERGEQDMKSEIERFPRLFRAVEWCPGSRGRRSCSSGEMTLWLGKLEVEIMQLGRGHTKGDTVVWLPDERILFSGDLVEFDATPYTGDAYLADWPATLDAHRGAAAREARAGPRRGAARRRSRSRPASTARARSSREMYEAVAARRARAARICAPSTARPTSALKPRFGHWVIFDHCLPFDVTRAYDEATQHPRSAHLDGAARQGDVAGAGRLKALTASRDGSVRHDADPTT